MINKIKILLQIPSTDNTKDALLEVLLEDCMDEAVNFCGLNEYEYKLDSAVSKMVIQRYNQRGAEGITSQSYSQVSESYLNGYSSDIMNILKKFRKVKFL